MNLVPKLDVTSQRYVTVTAKESKDQHRAVFTVKGVSLGTARLSFVAQAQRGTIITSNVQDIQVRAIIYVLYM